MSALAVAPPTPAAPRMTPEEFLQLPDEGRGYELVDGQLKERAVSIKPSRTGIRMATRLELWCETNTPAWIVGSDASFRCFPADTDRIRRADVAVILYERLTLEQYETKGFILVRPDLVVEVISPNDVASDITRKRKEWLAAGVKLLWIVDPEDQSVHAYEPGKRPLVYEAADELPGEPVLPGFKVIVGDLFKLPVPPA